VPAYRLDPKKTFTDDAGRRICEILGAGNGHDDVSVAWLMLPAGCRGVEETNDYTEVVIVLSGEGLASIDDRSEKVAAGHAVYVPRGARWRLENAGGEPLVCYAVVMPAFRPELFHPA